MREVGIQESNRTLTDDYLKYMREGKAQKKKIDISQVEDDPVYYSTIITFISEINKPLTECNEQDIKTFLQKHTKTGGAWNTRLSILRGFFKWMINRNTSTPAKQWKPPTWFNQIPWESGESDKYDLKDMWTEDEILIAIEALDHPRDKGLIAVGYDLGPRPHELMDLKIGDIILHENYAEATLKDHSNPRGRTVQITKSFPYLLTWLNNHPLKNNPKAPLWTHLKGVPSKMGVKALYMLTTRKLKSRIGHKIHKPFNPYCMFDHSRLTNLTESGMTEFELKSFRGWKPNSKMPGRYIHMTGKGHKKKLLELAGIEKADSKDGESPLSPKICYRCKHKNAPDAKYCVQCNFVLSVEAFEELRQKEEQRDKDIVELKVRMEAYEIALAEKVKNDMACEMASDGLLEDSHYFLEQVDVKNPDTRKWLIARKDDLDYTKNDDSDD